MAEKEQPGQAGSDRWLKGAGSRRVPAGYAVEFGTGRLIPVRKSAPVGKRPRKRGG